MQEFSHPKQKGPNARFLKNINNNGIPSMNAQNLYNPDIRDWEHRKQRFKGNTYR
jgi:hypothetical protein